MGSLVAQLALFVEGSRVEKECRLVQLPNEFVRQSSLESLVVEGGDGVVLMHAPLVSTGIILNLRGVLYRGGSQAFYSVRPWINLIWR